MPHSNNNKHGNWPFFSLHTKKVCTYSLLITLSSGQLTNLAISSPVVAATAPLANERKIDTVTGTALIQRDSRNIRAKVRFRGLNNPTPHNNGHRVDPSISVKVPVCKGNEPPAGSTRTANSDSASGGSSNPVYDCDSLYSLSSSSGHLILLDATYTNWRSAYNTMKGNTYASGINEHGANLMNGYHPSTHAILEYVSNDGNGPRKYVPIRFYFPLRLPHSENTSILGYPKFPKLPGIENTKEIIIHHPTSEEEPPRWEDEVRQPGQQEDNEDIAHRLAEHAGRLSNPQGDKANQPNGRPNQKVSGDSSSNSGFWGALAGFFTGVAGSFAGLFDGLIKLLGDGLSGLGGGSLGGSSGSSQSSPENRHNNQKDKDQNEDQNENEDEDCEYEPDTDLGSQQINPEETDFGRHLSVEDGQEVNEENFDSSTNNHSPASVGSYYVTRLEDRAFQIDLYDPNGNKKLVVELRETANNEWKATPSAETSVEEGGLPEQEVKKILTDLLRTLANPPQAKSTSGVEVIERTDIERQAGTEDRPRLRYTYRWRTLGYDRLTNDTRIAPYQVEWSSHGETTNPELKIDVSSRSGTQKPSLLAIQEQNEQWTATLQPNSEDISSFVRDLGEIFRRVVDEYKRNPQRRGAVNPMNISVEPSKQLPPHNYDLTQYLYKYRYANGQVSLIVVDNKTRKRRMNDGGEWQTIGGPRRCVPRGGGASSGNRGGSSTGGRNNPGHSRQPTRNPASVGTTVATERAEAAAEQVLPPGGMREFRLSDEGHLAIVEKKGLGHSFFRHLNRETNPHLFDQTRANMAERTTPFPREWGPEHVDGNLSSLINENKATIVQEMKNCFLKFKTALREGKEATVLERGRLFTQVNVRNTAGREFRIGLESTGTFENSARNRPMINNILNGNTKSQHVKYRVSQFYMK